MVVNTNQYIFLKGYYPLQYKITEVANASYHSCEDIDGTDNVYINLFKPT